MKAEEIRQMTGEQAQAKLLELLDEQFKLRMQHGTGQLANTARLRGVRKDIARVRQVLGTKEGGQS